MKIDFMRSYGQRCGLAKALDVVGDRWTLLIIRELLIRGACRYTDLREGLPGIASNLLADRLRGLEDCGVIVRRLPDPPIATALFELTERGRDLAPAIIQLGLWGAPLLKSASKGDALRAHWIVLPLRHYLADSLPDAPDAEIELRIAKERIAILARRGRVKVRPGSAQSPQAVIAGKAEPILHFLAGQIDGDAAAAAGLRIDGSREVLRRVIPRRSVAA